MRSSPRLPSLWFLALSLASCSQPPVKTEYTASPEIVAVFAGQARGADLSLARACGADGGAVRARAAGEQVPAMLSTEAGSIYKTALVARASEMAEKPSASLCEKLRGRQDLAGLFTGGRPSTEPSPPLHTRGAYCAAGSEAVRRDPAMSTGLEAIHANCRRGDTIALPADAIGIIASVCDLSKPTPASGANVFCTIGTVRRIRGVTASR